MKLFLIGPSGSGKDTQARLISETFNLKWVSTGDLFRKRSLIDDDFGKIIKERIDNGLLVEWQFLQVIVRDELQKNSDNFIWTGFPRTVEQSIFFDKLSKELNTSVDLVINLTLNDEITKSRIENRRLSDELVREDDKNEKLIERRLLWYKESIDLLREHYSETNRFVDVDASDIVENVFEEIKKIINKRFNA